MSLYFDVDSVYPNESFATVPDALGPYLGYDVLTVKHNMRDPIAECFARRGELVAAPTGMRSFDDHAGQALPTRSFQWTAFDRTGCNAIRAFLDARQGRLVPFWIPTCCWDLRLNADLAVATQTLPLRRSGYTDYYWPTANRRYISIWAAGGTQLAKVTGASLIDARNEQITIDAPTAGALPATTAISYLVLCRLAEDLTTLNWFSTWGCEASIHFVELPHEVPA